MKRIACFLAAASLVAAIADASASIPEQVKIETGLIEGTISTSQPSVRVFKGIPFAAPPLGENRWRAPQPAAKWDGVRKADAFGAPCIAGAPAAPGQGPESRRRLSGFKRATAARGPASAAAPDPDRAGD